MTTRDFPRFDETNAPAPAREPLAKSKRTFGAIPAPLACYASSPLLLQTALSGLDAFDHASLAPLEREVLAMTMGRRNGCKFCVDLHRRLLAAQQAPASLIEQLENGVPLDDARLEALRTLVLALLETHGDVPRAVWTRFREAGYTHQHALEIVAGVGVYTMTTLANRLTETSE